MAGEEGRKKEGERRRGVGEQKLQAWSDYKLSVTGKLQLGSVLKQFYAVYINMFFS